MAFDYEETPMIGIKNSEKHRTQLECFLAMTFAIDF